MHWKYGGGKLYAGSYQSQFESLFPLYFYLFGDFYKLWHVWMRNLRTGSQWDPSCLLWKQHHERVVLAHSGIPVVLHHERVVFCEKSIKKVFFHMRGKRHLCGLGREWLWKVVWLSKCTAVQTTCCKLCPPHAIATCYNISTWYSWCFFGIPVVFCENSHML